VVRCLALARELRDEHLLKVGFAMRSGPLGISMVREAGFPVVEPPGETVFDYRAWLVEAGRARGADRLVLDVRDELTADDIAEIRAVTGARVAVVDDASDRRLAADDVFYPPVPQVLGLEWPGFHGNVHTGWQWVPLRPEFAVPPERWPHEPPAVLLAMGGSDPAALTLKAVRALARVGGRIECIVLVGPGFAHEPELAQLLETFPHESHVVRNGDVRANMLAADLGVLSFGVTAYEAAACALPAIHVCINDDSAVSSLAFAAAGMAVSLGRADHVEDHQLAAAIEEMLSDNARQDSMSATARRLVDGNGVARIARVIASGGTSD
jgi:spore coat polysaccharide biosynthesis protein SpsF